MTTQPAGEHHTGTLNLTGEGNQPASTPGPAADLIEHAASIIVASRKRPHTAPGHWAGALWEAGMLVAPGTPTQEQIIRQQVAEQIAAKGNEIAERHTKSAADHRAIAIEHGTETPKGQRHMRTAHSFRDQAAGAWEVAHAAREIGGGA